MARNEEKAQSLLNKWVTMKKEFKDGASSTDRRPFLATECDNLTDAERWRRQIIKEISKKVSEIQNAGLGEHRIRDINDHINKLIREKAHWQRRIRDLGGPDYNALEPKSFDADGRELAGGGGYKYFGAARDLPGVRELFEQEAPQKPRRTRGDMFKGITPDYYGYRDEDDGVLVRDEAAAETAAIAEAVDEHHRAKRAKRANDGHSAAGDDDSDDGEAEAAEDRALEAEAEEAFVRMKGGNSAATDATMRAYVPVVSQDAIAEAILEKKKAALLAKLGA